MPPAIRSLVIALLLVCSLPLRADGPYRPAAVEVFFSPNGGCTDAVVKELAKAKKTVF
jgi:hypothetical protein